MIKIIFIKEKIAHSDAKCNIIREIFVKDAKKSRTAKVFGCFLRSNKAEKVKIADLLTLNCNTIYNVD